MRCSHVLAIALLVCSGFDSAQALGDAGPQSSSPDGNRRKTQVMKLELPELDGTRMLNLTTYADKPVVLNFWSSDCPPCVTEMPMLLKQALMYPSVQFFGIAVDDRLKARRFLQSLQVTYPQMVAPTQADGIMRRFGNPKGVLPYTVVLSKSHQICQMKSGMVDAAWIQSAVVSCSA
jgi:thiol-disulfide isomerase/thioredoxin